MGKLIETLSQKQNTSKRTGDIAQVVACFLSVRKAVGSFPGTKKEAQRGEATCPRSHS
jgi:hypothetical protein